MYKKLLEKQFMIDFDCTKTALNSNVFTTYIPTKNSRHFARGRANIVIYNNKLYIRTDTESLTQKLKEVFSNIQPEWFFELKYIEQLSNILFDYNLKITNFAPFFIPKNKNIVEKSYNEKHKFFYKDDIQQFKKDHRIKMSFGYSNEEPDTLGLGYFDEDILIAICGTSQNGKYTSDIGIEILNDKFSQQGVATNLIKVLTAKSQEIYPNTIPVYSTALSHTKSMNVAINAGYYVGWTEILIN